MSNSNLKTVIIAAAVAGIGGGGYFLKSTINDRDKAFVKQVETIAKKLPATFKFERVSNEMGLLETNGSFRLTYNNPLDKSLNASLVMSYHVEHNAATILGGDVDFVGQITAEGNAIKNLQIKSGNNTLSKLKGSIKEDGTILLFNELNDFSMVLKNPTEQAEGDKTGYLVKVKSARSDVTIKNDLSNTINLPEISLENQADTSDKVFLKGVVVNYNNTLSNPDLAKLNVKLSSFESSKMQTKMENIDFLSSQEFKNKIYNIKLDAKVGKLNNEQYKNASLLFKGTLNGIDKDLFSIYNNLGSISLIGGKISEQPNFANSIKNGLSFELNKFALKNETDNIEITGNYSIAPTEEGKTFSLAKQSKFDFTINTEGALFTTLVMGKIEPEKVMEAKSSFKVAINYENDKLKVNEEEVTPELNGSVVDLLSQFSSDNKLESYTPPVPTTTEEAKPQQ